jgi:hypothetical protein
VIVAIILVQVSPLPRLDAGDLRGIVGAYRTQPDKSLDV